MEKGKEENNFIEIIKDEIQKNLGDEGILVYKKLIMKLNIGENPSKEEVENLVAEIDHNKLFGKTFREELHQKLNMCEKFSPIFWNLILGKIKWCPKCEIEYKLDCNFCSECGTALKLK